MIRKLRISLLFVLVIQAFTANSQSTDVRIDSSFTLSPYLFKSDLFQKPAVMLFDNFSPRSFTRYKKSYQDTAIIRTSLYYELGLRKYQDLRIEHVQRLNETTSLILDYNRETYTGIYQNEGFSRDRLFTGIQGSKKKWRYDAFLIYYNLDRELNGGLIYDTLFTDTIIGRQFLPVLNEGAGIRLKTVRWDGHFWRQLGQDSSLRIGFDLTGQREFFSYTDGIFTDSVGVLNPLYLDSLRTIDGYIEGYEQYGLGLRKEYLRTSYSFSMGYVNTYYRNYGIIQAFKPYVSYQIKRTGKLALQHELIYVAGKQARLSMLGSVHWQPDSTNTLLLRGMFYSGPVSAFYNTYLSNHIIRNTPSVPNLSYGEMGFAYLNNRFHLGFRYDLRVGNGIPVLNDTAGVYTQTDASAHWITLTKNIHISKGWLLAGRYEFFAGDETYFQYPTHRFGGSIKRSGSLFKGKMTCWIQARYSYTPAFKQYTVFEYTYDLIPSNRKIPSYGYFDVRTGATIGNVDLFLNAYNVSEGLFGYTYFDFPRYPGKDRLISFGVLLKFSD